MQYSRAGGGYLSPPPGLLKPELDAVFHGRWWLLGRTWQYARLQFTSGAIFGPEVLSFLLPTHHDFHTSLPPTRTPPIPFSSLHLPLSSSIPRPAFLLNSSAPPLAASLFLCLPNRNRFVFFRLRHHRHHTPHNHLTSGLIPRIDP